MSILHMNPEFNVEFVVNHLKSVEATDVKVTSTDFTSECFIITFNYKGEDRRLNFHYHLGLFKSNLLTLGAWGYASEILTGIAEKFGGVFQKDDCVDDCVIYDQPQYRESDAIYVLKWAISNGYVSNSKSEDVQKAKEIFDKKIKNY